MRLVLAAMAGFGTGNLPDHSPIWAAVKLAFSIALLALLIQIIRRDRPHRHRATFPDWDWNTQTATFTCVECGETVDVPASWDDAAGMGKARMPGSWGHAEIPQIRGRSDIR